MTVLTAVLPNAIRAPHSDTGESKSMNMCSAIQRDGPPLTRLRTHLIGALLGAFALVPTTGVAAEAACNLSTADLYESKSPAVVLITALMINPYRSESRVTEVIGSGFIIDPKGLLMTNSHVVFGAQVVTVTLDDGTTVPAKVLGADPIFDLAIVQIPVPDHAALPVLTFADSDAVRPGEPVSVIGNPEGFDQTITNGIVSGLNRILPERPRMLARPMIQTDAAINPGNSGGPLLNRCGDVIGVLSEMLSDSANIGFAIPSNLARSVVDTLVKNGRVKRPWFGIDGSLIDSEMRQVFVLPPVDGFLVEAVEPDSPASLAGIVGGRLPVKVGVRSIILGGDVILAVNGIELKDGEDVQRALDSVRIGTTARLEIYRDGKTITRKFAITERPLQPGDVPESSQSFSVQQDHRVKDDATP